MFRRRQDPARRSLPSEAPVSKNGLSLAAFLPNNRADALAFGFAFGFGDAPFGALSSRSLPLFHRPARGRTGQLRNDRAGHTDNLRKAIEQFLPGLACVPGCVQLAT